MALRINEAIERNKILTGKKASKKELSKLLKGKSEISNYISFSRLVTGKAKNVNEEFVRALCDKLGCDPNFLFDYD